MSEAPEHIGPALAVLELSSIARAFRVADAMVKQAPSRVWQARPISPGHFLILITGGVAEVDESFRAGLEAASGVVVDDLFLPAAAEGLLAHIAKTDVRPSVDALGVIETTSVSATIRAADATLKAAEVSLVHLHLGRGIGGKGVFAFTGLLHDVQAGLEAATHAAHDERILHVEEIPAPHGAMTLEFLGLGSTAPDY